MTDIYRALSLKIGPGKAEPDVWVRRIVIYRQITPDVIPVREISLTRGVNIIWAEEAEDERSPAEITGHSAGKTSFCRLLRYALGERTYGTKANMSLIRRAFPTGYLGAELLVRGQLWAIVRPIGNGIMSYIKAGATLEALLKDKSNSATLDEYPVKLGLDALLDNLDAGAVLRTNRAIEWGHLLAWCARDQEARFQNCFDWRSPRSESDWPSFRSSRADPLFVMRTVLDLFLPDELREEEELAKLVQTKEILEKKLPELKREPLFRVNLNDLQLRRRLRELLPDVLEIDSVPFRHDGLHPDLNRLTDMAKDKLESDSADIETERSKLEEQLETLVVRIGLLEDRLKKLDTLFKVDAAGQQQTEAGAEQREGQRKLFEDNADSTCQLGGVLYGECPLVQERQQALQIIRFQDAQAMKEATAVREKAQKTLAEQKQAIGQEITAAQETMRGLRAKRKSLESAVQGKRDAARDVYLLRNQVAEWTTKVDAPGQFKALDECKQQLKDTDTKIQQSMAHLDDLLKQHDTNRKLLSSVFSAAVRGVLPSGGYDGQVQLVDRELRFQITRGTAMSGEAVETLAVLLADVACMVYNSVSERARLPGFLMHDSPREADLSLRLYHRFISLLASLQGHFSSAEACPFQYIITTTTPPPQDLRDGECVKLHLNAAVPEETLFQQNLAKDVGRMQFGDQTETEGQTR